MFVPADDGRWVDENFARMAEVVHDYDNHLELRWIPPDKRTREDKKPYVIWDTFYNKAVLYASEIEKPHEILARLFLADNANASVLQRLEKEEAAKKLLDQKAFMEKLEEAHDKANFLINTPLHYIKLGKNSEGRQIKMDETRRRIS